MSAHTDVTRLLEDASAGDTDAGAALVEVIYGDLRRLAHHVMQAERASHTLQPTALVHEVYLRLTCATRTDWRDRAHFFAVAALQMRRVLVDHARHKKAERRGGGVPPLSLDAGAALSVDNETDVLALHDAITALEAAHARPAQVVVMRFFGGMTVPEVAAVLGVSARTVEGDFALARAWLRRALAAP